MRLGPDGRTATAHTVFADGWLEPGQPADAAWGRPVGLLHLPDGSMLVADDKAGAVYRVAYNESVPASGAAAPARAAHVAMWLLACALACVLV